MVSTDSEIKQVSLLLEGDRKAISIFTDIYGQFMYNICYKILQNSADAEEATQDAVMKVLKNLHTFDKKSSLKAWCYTIAYRTSIDYKRKIKYTVDLNTISNYSGEGRADYLVEADETKDEVAKMIGVLDDESKVIVTLFYLEEKNIKEVMELTGLTESNIKIKLFRARKQMVEYANKYSTNK